MRISDWSSDVCSSDLYRSPIPESCRWRTWAADPEGMTGDALKDFIDNNLFPQLQNLHEYSNTPSAFVVRSVFEDARSEERRVGKECVSTCRSRWSPYHYKTTT